MGSERGPGPSAARATGRTALDGNPRYTGYAFFGRWTRQEMLVEPDDVAAGSAVRFRRSNPDRIVGSRERAHPEIISVEDFTQAQLLRRSKASGGLRTARKAERSGRPTKRTYLFRGRIGCAACGRKMEASPRAHGMYYRCPARTLAPGSLEWESHPPAVYLREDLVRDAVNDWLGQLFDRENVDHTVAALVASQGDSGGVPSERATLKKKLADAEARLSKFHAAIEAGVDPAAIIEAINAAQSERAALKAELEHAPTPSAFTDAEIHAMVDSLGDVCAALSQGEPERLASLYTAVDLHVRYQHDEHAADIQIHPARSRVNSARVRGELRTDHTPRALGARTAAR